jgi:hypothetical protein
MRANTMINWKSAYSDILTGEIPNSKSVMTVLTLSQICPGSTGVRIMGERGKPQEMTLSALNDTPKLAQFALLFQVHVGGINPYSKLKALAIEHKHIVVWDPEVLNR